MPVRRLRQAHRKQAHPFDRLRMTLSGVEWACRGAGARSYRSLIARTGHPSSVAECALDQLNLSRRLHGRIGFPEQGPRFRLLSGARQGKPVGKGQSG